MTDKVQKIREEVVEIVNSINLFIPDEDGKNSNYEAGKLDAATQILQIIDSLEEPVSEDLEEAAVEAFKEIVDDERNSFLEIFKAGANWKKTKLMANATEITVHIDAGGYPCIPQMELYNYEKDAPLAKEGDKYKVILIKEN